MNVYITINYVHSNETNFAEAVAEKYRAYTLRSPELSASLQQQLAHISSAIAHISSSSSAIVNDNMTSGVGSVGDLVTPRTTDFR